MPLKLPKIGPSSGGKMVTVGDGFFEGASVTAKLADAER